MSPNLPQQEQTPTGLHAPGSDEGARHWAVANTLIVTAKLNGIEPLAYITDVLERIVSRQTKAHELHSLLPWNWRLADQTNLTATA